MLLPSWRPVGKDGPRRPPSVVALEVHAPDARRSVDSVLLRADGAVPEPHRLVLDRAQIRRAAAARRSMSVHRPVTFESCPTSFGGSDRPCRRASAPPGIRTTPDSSTDAASVRLHAGRNLDRRCPPPATCRDSQIPTSFAPSRVPPNQAATSPSLSRQSSMRGRWQRARSRTRTQP